MSSELDDFPIMTSHEHADRRIRTFAVLVVAVIAATIAGAYAFSGGTADTRPASQQTILQPAE